MLYLSCMTTVERFWSAFAWAEPMQDNELHLITIGNKLQISGFFPTYKNRSRPTDLLSWYEALRRNRSRGKPNSEEDSPHVVFANADNDEKLIAFVKRFGPVVAEFVHEEFGPPHLLTAKQDLAELRRERFVYCSALSLVLEVKRSLARPKRRFDFGKSLIRDIVSNTSHWPEQWERERKLRKREPSWRPTELDRIQQIAVSGPILAGGSRRAHRYLRIAEYLPISRVPQSNRIAFEHSIRHSAPTLCDPSDRVSAPSGDRRM